MSNQRHLEAVMGQGPMLIEFYRNNPCIAAYDLLGVDLAPIQRIVFEDMWFRDYTISICGRGLGKTFMLGTLAALSCLLYPGYRVGLIGPAFRQCFCNDINNLHTFWTSEGLKTGQDFFDSIQPNSTKIQSLNTQNTVLNKWQNPLRDGVTVFTSKGLEFAGTLDHKVLTLSENASLDYKELKDLDSNSNIVVRKGFNYFGNDNKLPECNFKHNWRTKDCKIPKELTPDLAYLFGLLVGDGCVSISKNKRKQRIMFISDDPELINKFEDLMLKYFNIEPTDRNSKNRSPQLTYYCKKLVEFLLLCGFTKTTTLDKKIPDVIKKSSKKCFVSFVRGLMDTDGCCYIQKHNNGYIHCEVTLNTFSKQLAKEYQSFLINVGIVSNLTISSKADTKKLLGREKYSKCSEAYKVRITGVSNLTFYDDIISFGLNRKEEDLKNYLNTKPKKTSLALSGVKSACMKLIYSLKPLLIRDTQDNKVVGKLYNRLKFKNNDLVTLDVIKKLTNITLKYKLNTEELNNLLQILDIDFFTVKPERFEYRKVETFDIEVEEEHCYWASGFINHNSKMIFSEVEKHYDKSPILREATVKKPTRGSDTAYLKYRSVEDQQGSFIEAIPIGNDGAKIRGSRYYLMCIDELAQIPGAILDLVLRPMGATKQDPMANVRRLERMNALIEAGLAKPEDFDEEQVNKMVMTSSGYYKFNHMYKRMRSYWKKIEEEGYDKSKAMVHQIPYTFLPKGFLDEENIKEAKRVMSSHEFRMEYEAEMISDSEGFFKASLVDGCTTNSGHTVELKGAADAEYILGIDPNQGGSASCGAVIVKLGTPNKLVNVLKLKGTKTQELVQAVQSVCEKYNIIRIFMDKGGGGKAVGDLLEEGYNDQTPIIDITNDDHKHWEGRHILELVNFSPKWISEANHSTLALLEDKLFLFPEPPTGKSDEKAEQYEIVNELKKQMLNIVVTQNTSGTLHFDTPKKGQNKDLYSALILACDGIKRLAKEGVSDGVPILYNSGGLFRERDTNTSFRELHKKGTINDNKLEMALLKKVK